MPLHKEQLMHDAMLLESPCFDPNASHTLRHAPDNPAPGLDDGSKPMKDVSERCVERDIGLGARVSFHRLFGQWEALPFDLGPG